MSNDLADAALAYHRSPPAGKIGVISTKPVSTQRDLSLAYSPGVAHACQAIVDDPAEAARVTARGNLVAVITNGTAVLGLGPIGPLASKPVMEGKGVLFKKFAGIDVFDIEVDETDIDRFCDIVAALEPTFGGINLEDIKGPECFEIERRLRERMAIPVFHDDQHGTAIIVAAAVRNGLEVVGKDIGRVKLVCSGAGAAALACLNLLCELGLKRENVTVLDIEGVVYTGRDVLMDDYKSVYARDTEDRTLEDAIDGADVFLGLSAPGVLKPEYTKKMANRPLILALANPTPEILPEVARAARPDALVCTGRSDYPNQVNNVLCFPFLFRGALDCGATVINEPMKVAAVEAIAGLARQQASEMVAMVYGGETLSFGPDYLIPKPFDPRLITEIAPAVARAAMESGVATRPITDFEAYNDELERFVFRTGFLMKPLFERARSDPKRLIFAEGESEKVLQAVKVVVEEGLAKPILIGRREVVEMRIERLGLDLTLGQDVELVDPQQDERYPTVWRTYHEMMQRRGVSPDDAKNVTRTNTTVIGALLVRLGEADAMICGTIGRFRIHMEHIRNVIGLRRGVREMAALSALILPKGTTFIMDTHVAEDPSAACLAEMSVLAGETVRSFGMEPKIAFLSCSNFGTRDMESAIKMRQATALAAANAPDLEIEGEMHADAAISERVRQQLFPNSRLTGQANLLVMPNLDSANIAFNLLKTLGDGLSIGPILLGAALPVHVLTHSVSPRGIVNMSAVAVVEAQAAAR